MSHYPGMAAVFPSIALLVSAISDATIATLGSGKRSDKQKISPLPVVLLTANFFAVSLMANAARFSVSRVIGIDRMFDTGEAILPELQPHFRFIHSTNLGNFLLHMLGQFRTPDGIFVTPLGRPFLQSPLQGESDEDMNGLNWEEDEEIEDLLDVAGFHDDGEMFCGQRLRWSHDPSMLLMLWRATWTI